MKNRSCNGSFFKEPLLSKRLCLLKYIFHIRNCVPLCRVLRSLTRIICSICYFGLPSVTSAFWYRVSRLCGGFERDELLQNKTKVCKAFWYSRPQRPRSTKNRHFWPVPSFEYARSIRSPIFSQSDLSDLIISP